MIETFNNLIKNNHWGKKPPNSGFLRENYLAQVQKVMGSRLIKVLIGQRRVGKSYILRQIMGRLTEKGGPSKNVFYLNKELADFSEVETFKDVRDLFLLYKKKIRPRGKIYVFLDEVQEIEGWEKIVNSLSQDPKEDTEVFITGSNSKMLSSELGTHLSGRFVPFEVFPYSYEEFIALKRLPKGKDSFLEYLQEGGLPELNHLIDPETKYNYVRSLKDSILLNDIVKRHSVKEFPLLVRLLAFLIGNIGGLFSINRIVSFMNDAKMHTNHETLSNYLSYLRESMIVHEAERYDIRGKNIIAGPRKYYLNDLSFRRYLSSGFDAGLSKHLENAVYLKLRADGYHVYVGSLYDLEVDFIAEKGSVRKYFQVFASLADERTAEREFRGLLKIKDNHEKCVVSLDDASFGGREGVRHRVAWDL